LEQGFKGRPITAITQQHFDITGLTINALATIVDGDLVSLTKQHLHNGPTNVARPPDNQDMHDRSLSFFVKTVPRQT
jgi:hypothetical protein